MKVTNNHNSLSGFLNEIHKATTQARMHRINEEEQKLLTSVFFFYIYIYICSDISYNNISRLPKDVFCCLGSLKYL